MSTPAGSTRTIITIIIFNLAFLTSSAVAVAPGISSAGEIREIWGRRGFARGPFVTHLLLQRQALLLQHDALPSPARDFSAFRDAAHAVETKSRLYQVPLVSAVNANHFRDSKYTTDPGSDHRNLDTLDMHTMWLELRSRLIHPESKCSNSVMM